MQQLSKKEIINNRPLKLVTNKLDNEFINNETIQEINSDNIFNGKKLLKIIHNGSYYFLRITKAGKLILTK